MQFNNTATGQGILQDINFLCNIASADDTEYPIVDKTRAVNNWYDNVIAEILDSMDEWDFQGSQAYSNLVANQQAYPFPTDILKIKRIEIDYDGDGDYVWGEPFDSSTYEGTIATSAEINNVFSETTPKYDAFANSAFLYPVPDTAVNSGLIVWHESQATALTATAAGNTAQPVFEKTFHRILSMGATLDFATKRNIPELIKYCEEQLYRPKLGLFDKLRKFYGTRTADKKLRVGSRYSAENYQ